jgi:type 1 fimbria pilin
MKKGLTLCAFAMLFAGMTAFAAAKPAAKPAPKPAKVTGEVIDSACYIKSGAKGAGHIGCAQACAKAGIPLALLEDGSNKVVWLASKEDATTPNEQLMPYAGKKVTVTGTWAERGGAKLLVVDSVQAAK